MGEEVRMSEHRGGDGGGGEDDEERVSEWEAGLPDVDDLAPLSQLLIPPELASAFSISPEPRRTVLDVNRASQNTFSSLRGQPNSFSSNNFKSFNEERTRDPLVVEEEEETDRDGADARKVRRITDGSEEADSALRTENSTDDPSARTLKRPRLVWTPQLHKRFVDVVAHLGIKNAVPKTIMQLMNVEGLTRENVASHLQKYRLYLKRMQGLSNEGPSASDQLFASTPVPQSLHESSGNGHVPHQMPMPYAPPPPPPPPQMMPMPVLGVAHGHGHMGMPVGNPAGGNYHGFESHPYNMFQQREWSYPSVAPNDK
ncbi:hypothetical protein L1049_013091 [Liquidambar formosana]|uniref:HTH myb-type domain-containing protein n=1 Tax=Liquidambar formosana TaxID=63359 RepID=A0AAP0WTZ9_LIQFO